MASDRLGERLLTRRRYGVELAVFVIAIAARVGVVIAGGGYRGSFGYDAPVYFSSADALVHGRLPYRDFVLVHPPGVMLALTPFAWSAHIIGDHRAFIAGCIAFSVLGGVNAVLVVRVATAIGLKYPAAILGGLFYAVWFGSVTSEYSSRLEPLGNFFVLCALLAFFARERMSPRVGAGLCGLALGAALSVKIWWALPLVLIVVACARSGGRRPVRWLVGGVAAAVALIDGPFFAAAPSQMWQMVVVDQLGRGRNGLSPGSRLSHLSYIAELAPRLGGSALLVVVLGCALLYAVVAIWAWQGRVARLLVVIGAAQLVVLALAPSWFGFYADYVSVAGSLTVAAGISHAWSINRSGGRIRLVSKHLSWVPVALAAVVTTVVLADRSATFVSPNIDARPLAVAVAGDRCVMSDWPMNLITLDRLTRDLSNGCRNWVDVTGRTYGVDKETTSSGTPVPRVDNVRWQRDLRDYLMSGDAAVITRHRTSGPSRASIAVIARGGIAARAGTTFVYRTPHNPIGGEPVLSGP